MLYQYIFGSSVVLVQRKFICSDNLPQHCNNLITLRHITLISIVSLVKVNARQYPT